jgi:hypothetical protein
MIKVKLTKVEFKEEDHPRAKDGKFGSGGGAVPKAEKKPEAAKPAQGKHELTSSNTHKIPISPKTPRPSEFIPAPPAIDVPPQVEKGMAVTAAARASAFDGQPKYIARNLAGKLRVSRDKPESGEYAKVTATFSEKDGYSITVENYSVKAGEPAQVEKPKPETPKPIEPPAKPVTPKPEPKPEPKPVTTAGPDPAAMASARAAFLKKNPGAEAALAKKYKFMHGPMSMDEFVQKAAAGGATMKLMNGENLIMWGDDVVKANKDVKAYFERMQSAAKSAPVAPPVTVPVPVAVPPEKPKPVAVAAPVAEKPKEEPKKPPVSSVKTTPVSKRMVVYLKNKTLEKNVNKALDLIDSVCVIPESFKSIPIIQTTSSKFSGYLKSTWTGEPTEIGVHVRHAKSGAAPTLAHEIGHYIDRSSRHALARGATGGCLTDAQRDELNDAFRVSNSINLLRKLSPGQYTKFPVYENGVKVDEMDVKTRTHDKEYYLSTTEVFARAYMQYIGVKTKNKEMIDFCKDNAHETRIIRESTRSVFSFPSQWTPEDFAPIEKIFDRIFEQNGWKKQ